MARVKSTRRPQRKRGELSWPNNIAIRGRPLPTQEGRGNAAQSSSEINRPSHLANDVSVSNDDRTPAAPSTRKPTVTARHRHDFRRHKITNPQRKKSTPNASKPPTSSAKSAPPNGKTVDPFDVAITRYTAAYETRLRSCRRWVSQKAAQHRISPSVASELYAYFGRRKYGATPSAATLSKHACEALELSEHDLGTDLWWARGQTGLFGEEWGGVFRGMVEESLREEGICGPGSVGESDVESWVGDDEAWDRMMGGGVEGEGEAEEELEGGEGVECQMEDGDGGDEWVGEGGDGLGGESLGEMDFGIDLDL